MPALGVMRSASCNAPWVQSHDCPWPMCASCRPSDARAAPYHAQVERARKMARTVGDADEAHELQRDETEGPLVLGLAPAGGAAAAGAGAGSETGAGAGTAAGAGAMLPPKARPPVARPVQAASVFQDDDEGKMGRAQQCM